MFDSDTTTTLTSKAPSRHALREQVRSYLQVLTMAEFAAMLRPGWYTGMEFRCPSCQPTEDFVQVRAPRASIVNDVTYRCVRCGLRFLDEGKDALLRSHLWFDELFLQVGSAA